MNRKLAPFERSRHSSLNFKKNAPSDIHTRFFVLLIIFIAIFLVLALRLFQLTVVKSSYYRFIAENNRIREIDIEAPRGLIVDRKGFKLATSEKKSNTTDSFRRTYPLVDATAHILGYQQLADREDLQSDACRNRLKLNDKIGKNGVEKIYECLLRGKKGKMLIEVDALGTKRKILSETKPVIGETIQLALDAHLQQKAYDFATTEIITNSGGIVDLKEKKVAIVGLKPKTGEILILVSTPSFNPANFEDNTQQIIQTYLTDTNQPLFNRVTEGTYPPGSVFKLAVAAGALQQKTIDEKFIVEDTGTIKAGPSTFGNWYFLKYGKTEGSVNLIKGLQRSNDIFFYKIGEKMGNQNLKNWVEVFGYGKKPGSLLPEKVGLVPSDFWKREMIGERWYLGDTYNLSIGQGYLLSTPLQVTLATTVFANGGYLCKPKLLKNEKPECKSLQLDKKTIELVREGMKQACATGGTGWPFFDFKPLIGCKTGTAESHLPSGIPHAWFTVMAPFDDPEIVLTVMVEEAGEGSNVAAPIAKAILKTYFERGE